MAAVPAPVRDFQSFLQAQGLGQYLALFKEEEMDDMALLVGMVKGDSAFSFSISSCPILTHSLTHLLTYLPYDYDDVYPANENSLRADLKELGVKKMGHRELIISALRSHSEEIF